jgi:hypothetical protein
LEVEETIQLEEEVCLVEQEEASIHLSHMTPQME